MEQVVTGLHTSWRIKAISERKEKFLKNKLFRKYLLGSCGNENILKIRNIFEAFSLSMSSKGAK